MNLKFAVKILIFALSIIFEISCTSEPKPQRDAHGSIIREDVFASDVEYKRRSESFRKSGKYGLTELAESCNEIYSLRFRCEYDFFVRLKLQCETPQGIDIPFHQPMRFKEIEVDIVNIDPGALKNGTRFPTTLTTSSDGEIEFSFKAKERLNNFQIQFTTVQGRVGVDRLRIEDPIIVPESFCARPK